GGDHAFPGGPAARDERRRGDGGAPRPGVRRGARGRDWDQRGAHRRAADDGGGEPAAARARRVRAEAEAAGRERGGRGDAPELARSAAVAIDRALITKRGRSLADVLAYPFVDE